MRGCILIIGTLIFIEDVNNVVKSTGKPYLSKSKDFSLENYIGKS